MTAPASKWVVSTGWLAARLGSPDLVLVDGSYHLPAAARDAQAEYLAGHIPGAVRFDVDAIADRSSPLPHMLPNAQQLAAEVGALGIADTDTIVVYEAGPLFSAARVSIRSTASRAFWKFSSARRSCRLASSRWRLTSSRSR